MAAAMPSCPAYPYHDFDWVSEYAFPARPPDTLLDNCVELGLPNPELCDLIDNPAFSDDEKKQLLLDGFIQNNGFPPFLEAEEWNDGLLYSKYPPDNVSTESSAYIRDAWVKIVSLSPSVIDSDQNKTYVNDSGTLQLVQAFTFVVPKEDFPSDCLTEYEICGYEYSLEAFDNGISLENGNQPTAQYAVDELYPEAPNNFTASLSIHSQYLIHHYQIVEHCTEWSCSYFCEYVSTEDRHDSLTVSDSRMTYYYGFIAFTNVFIDYFQNGLADGWLFVVSNEDFNNIEFAINGSSLDLQSRQYQLQYFLPPYNALTPIFSEDPNAMETRELSVLSREARELSGEEFDSFLKVTEPFLYYYLMEILGIDLTELPITFYGDKSHFLAPADALDCTVEINSHFRQDQILKACNYDETQNPVINLSLSEVVNDSFQANALFFDNSTGMPLTDKTILFSYANQNASLQTNTSGMAQTIFDYSPGTRIVTASFWADFETKSAKANAFLPSTVPNVLQDWLFWIVLLVAIWLLSRCVKRRLL